ncbi:MAG: nucleotide exchange factor GrpE [Candidatus Paceibacterota bacterium]|jgi:molecular chaperone GrpE
MAGQPDDKKIENEQDDVVFSEIDGDDDNALDDDSPAATQKLRQKVKKLKEELASCSAEKKEYLDGWQRAKADFINYKRSSEREKEDLTKFANASIVSDILSALDAFDIAFANKESWEKVDKNWRTGVEGLHSKLIAALTTNGLEEITAIGEKLNPAEHQPIGIKPVDTLEEDEKVTSVFQKGYKLKGRVLRPAKVIVGSYSENNEDINKKLAA